MASDSNSYRSTQTTRNSQDLFITALWSNLCSQQASPDPHGAVRRGHGSIHRCPPAPACQRMAAAGSHCFHRAPLQSRVLHFSSSDNRGSCEYSGMVTLSRAVSAATFYYHALLGSRFPPTLIDKDIACVCSGRGKKTKIWELQNIPGHRSSGNFMWKTNITACPLWGTENRWSKASIRALLSTQIANSCFSPALLQADLRHNTTLRSPGMAVKLKFSKLKSHFVFCYGYLLTCSPHSIQTQIFDWYPSISASEGGKRQGKE